MSWHKTVTKGLNQPFCFYKGFNLTSYDPKYLTYLCDWVGHTRVVTVTNSMTPGFPWLQESHGYDRPNHANDNALFVTDVTTGYNG
jgi:hypothetical protein